ncbi:hypothetical protein ACFFR3_46365 [Nonomuraea salmonea]|uniref:Uncharacterized protein n=1 Tax=Nonomuraea salmonea TaxID=46181 RepID=A0ABV5P305_9ACTN
MATIHHLKPKPIRHHRYQPPAEEPADPHTAADPYETEVLVERRSPLPPLVLALRGPDFDDAA